MKLLATALLLLAATLATAQESAPITLTGADMRPAQSLNGPWHVLPDPYSTGLFDFHNRVIKNGWFMNQHPSPASGPLDYNFATAPTVNVPGDWNTQRPEFFWYEDPMWYEKDFDFQPKPNTRTFLHIGAANYKSYFWVNTQKVCEHEGGFTAFNCDITAQLHPGANFITAVVDNTRHADGVPTTQTDWFNYGGLTREVSLITVPSAFIDQYDLHLSKTEPNTIEGWVHLMGAGSSATLAIDIPELKVHQLVGENVTDGGIASQIPVKFTAPGLTLWTPSTPKLYKVTLHANAGANADTLTDEIGFRTIETRGTQILLNGKPIFLQGVCIHAEAPYRTGRAWSTKDNTTLLTWAKEMGANYVRLAHYPHDETMLRAADRMGILVWAENPVYWAVQFDNPAVYAKAQQQLDELINAYRDHPAIILWSMANETPDTEARTKFISALAAHARELDPSRLITAALLVRAEGHTKIVDDPLGKYLDVLGTNEYVGWYDGDIASIDQTTWRVDYNKPQIMSEFGAGAKAGLHGPITQRWTEEYQAELYKHQFAMLNKIPTLRGITPWILMDFRSPRRMQPGIQDGFNRKGLITEQGVKKQAFAIVQQAYKAHTIGHAE